ncbi:MAG: hemolysin [Chthoniobacter sp.]|jgi:hemolysin III|nr:hemolysin [Chthoniobacter sp.]
MTVERPWSRPEEIANSVSHGIGFCAAVIGAPFLIISAYRQGDLGTILGAGIFAVTTTLLYLTSAVQHWLPPGPAKDQFELFDRGAIFLLIAGSYTPFTLGVLRGPWGWALLATIWTLAITCVILKVARRLEDPLFSIYLYLGMGCLVFVATQPLVDRVPLPGLLLLLGGGIAYIGGLAFYFARRIPYHHLLWHLCVLTGTTCHYFAILWYATGKMTPA